jgi:hypothetical protein
VFGVVGFEQLLHTGPGGPPLYQALHWLSDSMLALPLGLAAVWIGLRIARWRGVDGRRRGDACIRACLIALIFAVMLVPGGIAHEQLDALTQSHAAISVHTHGGIPATKDWRDPSVMAAYITHAFSDGLIGQLVGLPLLILALGWLARRPSRATTRRTQSLQTERMTYAQ